VQYKLVKLNKHKSKTIDLRENYIRNIDAFVIKHPHPPLP